jgi:hypothetical protein
MPWSERAIEHTRQSARTLESTRFGAHLPWSARAISEHAIERTRHGAHATWSSRALERTLLGAHPT